MDPLLMLGGLAVIVGVIGVIVLLKGRKKSLNEKKGSGSVNRH